MIRRIQVQKLFGLYDYNIQLDTAPAVKILTGPNGYGKTTILRAIDHLYKENFWYFHFLSFENFVLTLSGQTIKVTKRMVSQTIAANGEGSGEGDKELFEEDLTLLNREGDVVETVKITEDYIQELLLSCKRRLSMRDPLYYNDEELIARYYNSEEDGFIQQKCKNLSLSLQEYRANYLAAQRIYNPAGAEEYVPYRTRRMDYYEIDYVNDEIGRLYRHNQNDFAFASQKIDATFVSRLVDKEDCYSRKELQEKLAELKHRIGEYRELNLFNDMGLLDYSLKDDVSYEKLKTALSLYVDDMNEKMSRIEDFYRKIALYRRVVTSKALSDKSISFSIAGITITNVNGRKLSSLHKLSSGEQNLLILYYNLIFCSNSKTILLIDEPENSLHVAWQSKMLDDYIAMAETTGCQILMATHSPTFIGGRWDLTTDLFRQSKEADAE